MRLYPFLAYTIATLALVGCSGSGTPLDPNDPGPIDDNDPAPITDPRTLNAPPADPRIQVAAGWQLSIFADGLSSPRQMVRRGNEVWVAERGGQRIRVLRDLTGDGYAEEKTTAASSLSNVNSIDYFRGNFYIATSSTVYTFRDTNNNRIADLAPRAIITGLPTGGHSTRTVKVNPATGKLYVSIGSQGNLGEEPLPRASVQEYNIDGTGGRTFASGMRNSVGINFHPVTHDLWAVNNGWDNLGDDLPHEHMWRVIDGGFYGWPYAYTHNGNIVPDPTFGPGNPAKVAMTLPAAWEFTAHVAPLGICFWETKAWGTRFTNDAFVAMHGSWVPDEPVGYSVTRVDFNPATNMPVAEEDLAWSFRDGTGYIGRPADVIQFGNTLLISDDFGGRIYRLDKI